MKSVGKRTCLGKKRFNDSTIQRYNVTFFNRQRACRIDLRLLRRIVQELLSEHLSITHCDVGVHLVAAPETTRLNETFLRHAGSTDVIAFDYSGRASRLTHHATRNTRHDLHGEIFVCIDEAIKQARRYRTSWQSEVVRYLIHGLLHLVGYDDETQAARRRMKREENRLLRKIAARFPLSQLGRRLRIRA